MLTYVLWTKPKSNLNQNPNYFEDQHVEQNLLLDLSKDRVHFALDIVLEIKSPRPRLKYRNYTRSNTEYTLCKNRKSKPDQETKTETEEILPRTALASKYLSRPKRITQYVLW